MSLKINILPQGTLAIYEQIVMQMKNAIVSGELTNGEALPSIRSLAAELKVSVITTKRAYEELEKEGLIRSVAGKGFYVCEYNTDYLSYAKSAIDHRRYSIEFWGEETYLKMERARDERMKKYEKEKLNGKRKESCRR